MVVHLELTIIHVKVEHCFVIHNFTYTEGSICKEVAAKHLASQLAQPNRSKLDALP